MKNIHLLPTEKEQHSIIQKNTGLLLVQTTDKVYSGTKLNLYITSDEEIKEGDKWIYNIHWNKPKKIEEDWVLKILNESSNTFKIILTTDQDLIEDGVQDIDDEFLEWFVKNPSCEEIEIGDWFNEILSCCRSKEECHCNKKRIIIPKEELKQELLPDFKITKNIFDFVTDLSDTNKEDPKQDPTLENAKLALREHILANKEKVAGDLQEMRKKSGNGRYETLEEASEMFISKYYSGEGYERDIEEAIKFGAKWMEEEMEKLKDFDTWKEWKNR